ncbi:MAG: DUF1501 domain-containing protein [Planctomycetes bacterium]|nr:DUF1501 domain-containing protein [Planctomycetota bacterium]
MTVHQNCSTCGDVSRRGFLKLSGTGVALGFMGASLHQLLFMKEALGVQPENAFYDAFVSIFFNGGPSQTDTWDPKPGTRSSYPNFQTINLGVNDRYGQPVRIGGQFANGNAIFPQLANLVMNDPAVKLGLVRSFWHGSNNHQTGQTYMNGWWRSQALVEQYPSMASAMAYYFQGQGLGIPSVVINGANGNRVNSAGESRCPTALQVNANAGNNPVVQSLRRPNNVDQARYDRRKALLDRLNQRFLESRPDAMVRAMEKATEDAYDVTTTGQAASAFDLTGKTILPPGGNNGVAMRMTLAQELVAAGIPYVAMGIGGNDSHSNNVNAISTNWGVSINQGLTAMAQNLKATGKRVLVAMYGDFGRTPATVNSGARDGRDHWGGGFSIGLLSINQPRFRMTAIGDTGPEGLQQWNTGAQDPIAPADMGAFIYRSLGLQIGQTGGKFDLPLTSRPAPPVDRVNNSQLLMETFGLV